MTTRTFLQQRVEKIRVKIFLIFQLSDCAKCTYQSITDKTIEVLHKSSNTQLRLNVELILFAPRVRGNGGLEQSMIVNAKTQYG